FFLDGALHANQTDAELVLEQLAHRAYAAISQMIDVVHRADVLAQFQQGTNRRDEIRGIERSRAQRSLEAELDIELQAADAAEIVLARVEEHSVEKRCGGLERRGVARAQL